MSKPYMPLMMGDWIKGTRGMRSNVKGVYIGLLIHQYDHGFLPSDVEDLALIEPEVGSVWVSLVSKFPEVEAGKRQNPKLEEVRAFWAKQGKNGSLGGRPKKKNPNDNPDINPKANPKGNHHIDLDHDSDLELNNKKESPAKVEAFDQAFMWAFDERTVEGYTMHFKGIDIADELRLFRLKCDNDRPSYYHRDSAGLRTAFQYQLKTAKPKSNGNFTPSKKQAHVTSLIDDHARKYGAGSTGEPPVR